MTLASYYYSIDREEDHHERNFGESYKDIENCEESYAGTGGRTNWRRQTEIRQD